MKTVAIIPARYHSTRLPGKPLLDLNGKSLIQWVFLQTAKSQRIDSVIVATDDQRIIAEIEKIGGKAVLTSPAHSSGTDRIAEVARDISCDLVLNVQGDEPFVESEMLDRLILMMETHPGDMMGTVAAPFPEEFSPEDPDKVKVVLDSQGYALYFSRSPIPYFRDANSELERYLHLGVYIYRRDFLLKYGSMPVSPLERVEKLEQLRALDNGVRIRVLVGNYYNFGIDNEKDYKKALKLIKEKGISLD